MAFRSKQQWKWCFASGQSFCSRWAHETPGGSPGRYRGLPHKVKRSKAPRKRS